MDDRFPHQNEGAIVYGDPSIRAACSELLGTIPTYHISSDVYDQCEISAWIAVYADRSLILDDAFRIAVDGETWKGVDSTPYEAQTDWLLVDARTSRWWLYERTRVRGPGMKQTQIGGAFCDERTQTFHPIESTTIVVDGRPWSWLPSEADRVGRVALTFMMMYQNRNVEIQANDDKNHWTLVLPAGSTVNDIVDDVMRKAPRA